MKNSVRAINAEILKDVIETSGGYFCYVTAPKEKAYINSLFNYARSKGDTTLYDVYSDASGYKHVAYNRCLELCRRLNGRDLYISGHNCMTFSVVFRFTHPTTGHECIAYITRDNDRFCDAI